MFPRILASRRLKLRPFAPSDIDDVVAYASRPEWGRYLPVPQPYTRDDALAYLATHRERDWDHDPVWALEYKEHVVGGIDLHLEGQHRAWIGYSVAPRVWGRGLASEAASAVLDAAFESLDSLIRIYASCDRRNTASARVLERVGMQREGLLRRHATLRGEPYDELFYALLREDWERKRSDP